MARRDEAVTAGEVGSHSIWSYVGLPVVLSLVGKKGSFGSLSHGERKSLVEELSKTVGAVRDVRLAKRGDLMVMPGSAMQKERILELTTLGEARVRGSPARGEKECRGIIFGVPHGIEDDEIQSALKEVGVNSARRGKRWLDGKTIASDAVVLTFSSDRLPDRVSFDYRSFVVKNYIMPPLQCWNCWEFGHHKEDCKANTRCRSCGVVAELDQNQESTHQCSGPASCVNCTERGGDAAHEAGTMRCPIYASRMKAMRSGTRSSPPAGGSSSQSAPLTPVVRIDHDLVKEVVRIKRRLEELEKNNKPAEIEDSPAFQAVQTRVEALEMDVDELKETVEPLARLPEEVATLKNDMVSMRNQLVTGFSRAEKSAAASAAELAEIKRMIAGRNNGQEAAGIRRDRSREAQDFSKYRPPGSRSKPSQPIGQTHKKEVSPAQPPPAAHLTSRPQHGLPPGPPLSGSIPSGRVPNTAKKRIGPRGDPQ